MSRLELRCGRTMLRDFAEDDRRAFVAYQMDERYRRLYDMDDDEARVDDLFSLFLRWRGERPRRNWQLGIFDLPTRTLLGCGGLRSAGAEPDVAILGIELAPSEWGRYRVALDAATALVEYGFSRLGLARIVGDTSSGNRRIEKFANLFGAQVVAQREGPDWMRQRGWMEIDWAIDRGGWRSRCDQFRDVRILDA